MPGRPRRAAEGPADGGRGAAARGQDPLRAGGLGPGSGRGGPVSVSPGDSGLRSPRPLRRLLAWAPRRAPEHRVDDGL